MSHCTTLIVIRDASSATDAFGTLDTLLEPFNENNAVQPYAVWLDDQQVGEAVAFYREHPEFCPGNDGGGPMKPFEEFVGEGDLDAWGEWTRQAVGAYNAASRDDGVYDPVGDHYAYMSTYNPKSRWDWWALGGRWHGFFQVKPGVTVGSEQLRPWRAGDGRTNGEQQVPNYAGHDAILGGGGVFGDDPEENFAGRADLARKGDIDFDAMRTLAAQSADATYDKFEEATKGLEVAPRWDEVRRLTFVEAGLDPEITLPGFRPEEGMETRRAAWDALLGKARTAYHSHPWIKALSEAQLLGFMSNPHDDYCVNSGGRAAFVERARNGAVTTFALLIDDEWYEKGKMGWWGMVADEKDPDQWSREFWTRVKNLPDDVYLAVVDVHI